MLHQVLTERIIKAFYQVYNGLGFGFLEKVYENALVHELRKQGVDVQQQRPLFVHYDGGIVGNFFADLVADDKVLLELKSAETINAAHVA